MLWLEKEAQAIRADVQATRVDVESTRPVVDAIKQQLDLTKTELDLVSTKVDQSYQNSAALIASILAPFVTTMEGVEERLTSLETTFNAISGFDFSGLQTMLDALNAIRQDVDAERVDIDQIVKQITPTSGHIAVNVKETST